MEKKEFEDALNVYFKGAPENFVPREKALSPELEGMQIFDAPLFGYASADDPFFGELKKPGVIGAHFIGPGEWLSGAKTVISLFLPICEKVRIANRKNPAWPANEWLHARIEGQAFQDKICGFAMDLLKKEGFEALAPGLDSRFVLWNQAVRDKTGQDYYTSNWSERHAAYAAGLGTFGLSKGLISRKGIAGRFLSIITDARFEPDRRPCTGIYDYCINCGACIRNCPAGAISFEKGKIHSLCSDFLNAVKADHPPYYGCGKCQVNVPCEDRAPKMGQNQ